MKRILYISLVLGWALGTRAAMSVNVPVGQVIPDGDPAGLASQVNVTGESGSIGDITIGLSISGTYNGDLYAYLEHGNGFAVLLNRAGVTTTDSLGYGDHGLNVTFQDGAPNIHTYQQTLGNPGTLLTPLTGVWGPDGRAVSPLSITGTEPVTATLSSFLGGDPNGEWTLFVADVNGGDLNQLVSWDLNVSVVPEPEVFGAVAGVLCLGVVGLSRKARLCAAGLLRS
jgi:subtilisin-like proprotein convertase family protein